jgi:hypothetical protein
MSKFKPGDRARIIKSNRWPEDTGKIVTILSRRDCPLAGEAYMVDLPVDIIDNTYERNWRAADTLQRIDEDDGIKVMDVSQACLIINRIKENSRPVYVR